MTQDDTPDLPASGRTLAEVAYGALKADILSGALLPGAALLTRELMARYGCGVSPLREALARLVAEGLLEASSHRGVRVPLPTLSDLDDIYRIRIALEREAVTLAMAHGDDRWEAGIVASLHRLERAPLPEKSGGSLRDWEARHRAFHASLIAAAPAPRLLRLIDQMVDQSERYRALRLEYFAPEKVGRFVAEHRALTAVVIDRDPGAADQLAAHLEDSRAFIAGILDRARHAAPQIAAP